MHMHTHTHTHAHAHAHACTHMHTHAHAHAHAHARAQVRRVGFKMPPQNLEDALSLFMKLFQEVYERQQGWLE